MLAFVSHLTADSNPAQALRGILVSQGLEVFLAHQDVRVSEVWRERILRELNRADLFFAIIRREYFESVWCTQEIGIAAARGIKIAPFSLDGAMPEGFAGHAHCRVLPDGEIPYQDVIEILFDHDPGFVLDKIITQIGSAGSYDAANAAFKRLEPHVRALTEEQALRLLKLTADNGEALGSFESHNCLPDLLRTYGHKLGAEDRTYLEQVYRL